MVCPITQESQMYRQPSKTTEALSFLACVATVVVVTYAYCYTF